MRGHEKLENTDLKPHKDSPNVISVQRKGIHTHQLLSDSLYQCGEANVVIFFVVINIFDEFGNDLGVRLRLKLVSFGDLKLERELKNIILPC